MRNVLESYMHATLYKGTQGYRLQLPLISHAFYRCRIVNFHDIKPLAFHDHTRYSFVSCLWDIVKIIPLKLFLFKSTLSIAFVKQNIMFQFVLLKERHQATQMAVLSEKNFMKEFLWL